MYMYTVESEKSTEATAHQEVHVCLTSKLVFYSGGISFRNISAGTGLFFGVEKQLLQISITRVKLFLS